MALPTRREGFLIQPYKQISFGLIFISLNVLFSALILFVFGYFIWDIYQTQSIYFQLTDLQSEQILKKLMRPVFIGAGLLGTFIFTTLIFSIRYTHKFYGPLVSITRYLDELKNGHNPEPIKLRAKDQLHDIADRLNDLHSKILSTQSTKMLENYLDDLVAGKHPKTLSLPSSDPLYSIAQKIEKLSQK